MNTTVVFIEPRKHKALAYVIKNALDNIDWPILFFHGTENLEYLQNTLQTFPEDQRKRITFRTLGVPNLSAHEYSRLLTDPNFYRSLPAEICLFMQCDSMIIPHPNNRKNIYKFLIYDYVGAPFLGDANEPHSSKGVGNGGFSLRRRSAMIELLEAHPWPNGGNEDLHISKYAKNKPTLLEALDFSTESLLWGSSFGLHAPWKCIQMQHLERVFPFIHELMAVQECY